MLYPQNNVYRGTWKFDGYWKFALDPDARGEQDNYPADIPGDRVIAVPASWNEQSNDLYHYDRDAWYEYDFAVPYPLTGKRAVLRFSCVLYKATVYVNGKYVGASSMAHLPFEFDITDWVVAGGLNKVVVQVSGRYQENEPMEPGDFYAYAGISRPVFLSIVNEHYIKDLQVDTRLFDGYGRLTIGAQTTGGGRCIAEINGVMQQVELVGDKAEIVMDVPDIVPWSCENPKLYQLHVKLISEGNIVDEYTLKIGFREIRVEGRQILLNGKPVILKGFGKHEDFHIIGKGLCHALHIRDFDLMKWVGANSFRTSHYPYSEEILDLADQYGFLVMAETPFLGLDKKKFPDAGVRLKAEAYLRALIERDRNHPSVISWSLGNECMTDQAEAEEFFLPLIKLAKEMDNRPLTYVAWIRPELDVVYKHVDIVGINRYYGWYRYAGWKNVTAVQGDITNGLKDMEKCLEEFAEIYQGPIMVTEFGADTIAGMHSTFLLQFTEEFQTRFLTEYIKLMAQKDYVAGMHIWNFADFATEQNAGRVMGNKKGLFTRERGPKQAAFAVRKLWTEEDGDGLSGLTVDPKDLFLIPGLNL